MNQFHILDLKTQGETMKGIHCYMLLLSSRFGNWWNEIHNRNTWWVPTCFSSVTPITYYYISHFTTRSLFCISHPNHIFYFIDVTLWHSSVSVVKMYQAAITTQNTWFLLPNTTLNWYSERLTLNTTLKLWYTSYCMWLFQELHVYWTTN